MRNFAHWQERSGIGAVLPRVGPSGKEVGFHLHKEGLDEGRIGGDQPGHLRYDPARLPAGWDHKR